MIWARYQEILHSSEDTLTLPADSGNSSRQLARLSGWWLLSQIWAHLGLQWRFPKLVTSVLAQHTTEACTGPWLTLIHFSLGPWIKSLAIRQKTHTSLLSCKLESQLVKISLQKTWISSCRQEGNFHWKWYSFITCIFF